MIVGNAPIGTIPVGSVEVADPLIIGPVDFRFDAQEPLFITVPGALWTEGVSYHYQPTDPISIGQEHHLSIESFGFSFETTDEITVSFKNTVLPAPIDYSFDIPGVVIETEHEFHIDSLEFRFDASDPLVIGQTHLAHVDALDYTFDDNAPGIGQTHVLQVAPIDFSFSVDEIWMWLPTRCMSFDSVRFVDGGVLMDKDPDGTPSTDRWYDRDRYRFEVKWPMLDRKTAFALVGFFETYRSQPFVFQWPADKRFYRVIMTNDVEINQQGGSNDWTGHCELVGTELDILDEDVMPIANAKGWTNVGETEALEYAREKHLHFLNVKES